VAWTAPRTWVTSEVPTAAQFNTHVRDNLLALRMAYATTLPASPADGDVAVLVDSTTVPTYQWMFRWNNGSSNADKWEFMGGAPGRVTVDTDENTSSAAYTNLATNGPTFTVLRAGQYRIAFGHIGGATSSAQSRMTVKLGAAAAADTEASTQSNTATIGTSQSRALPQKTLAASDVVLCQYKSVDATSTGFRYRWMEITPVRVS
jgi:hypothetical protein